MFTPAEAKKWLTEHDFKPTLEEATGEGEEEESEKVNPKRRKKNTILSKQFDAGDVLEYDRHMQPVEMPIHQPADGMPAEDDMMPGDHMFRINDMQIFAAGKWNDEEYSIADLDDMVSNFNTLKDEVRPILKLGHSEEQELLEGMPAVGWISALRREGEKLYADVEHIPARIASLIAKKAYRHVSAEVYWDYESASTGRTHRRVLAGVALLGEEMPAVKTISDIEDLYRMSRQDRKRQKKNVDAKERHLVKFSVKKIEDEKGGEDRVVDEALQKQMKEMQEQIQAKDKENKDLTEKVAKLAETVDAAVKALDAQKQQTVATEKKLTEAEDKARAKDIEIFVESVSSPTALHVLPKDRELVKAILGACSDAVIVKYAENGTAKEVKLGTAIRSFIQSLPKMNLFREISKAGKKESEIVGEGQSKVYHDKATGNDYEIDEADEKLNQDAMKIAAERKIPFADALVIACKEDVQ